MSVCSMFHVIIVVKFEVCSNRVPWLSDAFTSTKHPAMSTIQLTDVSREDRSRSSYCLFCLPDDLLPTYRVLKPFTHELYAL
jgi:hypothetical protein